MRRTLVLAFLLCFVATSGFAQSNVTGKWRTDRPPDSSTIIGAQQQQQRVQLEVTVEGDKASGLLQFGGIGGRLYTFKDGQVTGNKIRFRTDPRTEVTWTIETVDDNTVMLYHGGLELVSGNISDLVKTLAAAQPTPVQAATVVSLPAPPAASITQVGANTPIRGIVQDPARALIPGVTVTAMNVDTGVQLTTVTDEAGRYSFPSAMPGKYTMTASLPGFQTKSVSNLSLGDTQLLQDFTLDPGGYRVSNPTPATCNEKSWNSCTLLHRAK